MKYDEHIKLLREVKANLPMIESMTNGFRKSRYICDNLVCRSSSSVYGLRPVGDIVGTQVKELVEKKIEQEFDLLTYLGFKGTFEEGQIERQKFLDELIQHYERLNEQS